MTQILMFFMLMNSIFLFKSNHPMTMGLILLIQTLLTCLITGMISKSFWFSYILFLIFVGGMMIIFIYMASLASNEMFNFKLISWANLMISFMLLIMFLALNNFWLNNFYMNEEMINFNNYTYLIKENFMISSKMYDIPNNWIIMFLINYLLLSLIIIVKITNYSKGPLRIKN